VTKTSSADRDNGSFRRYPLAFPYPLPLPIRIDFRYITLATSAHDSQDLSTPFQFCGEGFLITKSIPNSGISHFESETQESFDFCLGGKVDWPG
jgi:hypothetical protein